MTMSAIRTGAAPSTLDTLQSVRMDEPGPPAPGEIQGGHRGKLAQIFTIMRW